MGRGRGPLFVLALVGAITLGAALAYWLDQEKRSSSGVRPGAPEGSGRASVREGSGAIGEASPEAGRETVARDLAAIPPAVPAGELTGFVLDANGGPRAGAHLLVTREEAREFTALASALPATPVVVGETWSTEDGHFRLPVPRGLPVTVRATLAGTCDALQPDAYAGQELHLLLEPGLEVLGTVTRARDGAPVPGARVRVFRPGGPASLERETTSAADGTFRLRIGFRDDVQLEVLAADLKASGWLALEPGEEDRCQRDVALEDGVLVTGRVLDADSGLPVPGAVVGEGVGAERACVADERGQYRLQGFGGTELVARAAGYGAVRARNLPAAVEGQLSFDVTLAPGRTVKGRVVDEDGTPQAGAYVAAIASEFGPGGQQADWLATRTDAEGRYRIGDLARTLGHALLVTRPGRGTQVHDFPASEFDTPELELPDVVLRRPALLAGRVEAPDGSARVGVEVELAGSNHDRYRFTKTPTARGRFYVDRRTARTDAEGRFWFGDLAAGRYQLVLRVPGRPESTPLEVEVVTGERREDLVLRLDAGGTLRGQVLGDRGQPLAGVYVAAQGERLSDPAARPASLAHVRTASDGAFVIAGLPEGEYTLRAYPLEAPGPTPDEPWLGATVEHVATGGPATRIELPRGARLGGRVVDARGAPLPDHIVAGVPGGGRSGEFAQTDVEGRFSLAVPRGSSWTLEVRGSPRGPAFQKVLARRAQVRAPATDLVLVVQD